MIIAIIMSSAKARYESYSKSWLLLFLVTFKERIFNC